MSAVIESMVQLFPPEQWPLRVASFRAANRRAVKMCKCRIRMLNKAAQGLFYTFICGVDENILIN